MFKTPFRLLLAFVACVAMAFTVPVAAMASGHHHHKHHATSSRKHKRHHKHHKHHRSRRGRRGKRGKRGMRGKTGPAGPQGLTGAQGLQGATGAVGPIGPVGPVGPVGPTHQSYYDMTAAPGHEVTLATIGPFTLIGRCTAYEESSKTYFSAGTYLETSEEHSALSDYEGTENSNFGPTTAGVAHESRFEAAVPGQLEVGAAAYTSQVEPERSFDGPDDGSTAAVSGNGEVWFNAFISTGVNVGQTTEAEPCLFFGHIYSPSIK